MTGKNLYVLLLVSLSLPIVFGKNHYFEHYFNKYHSHKSSSTTPSISSTSDIPTSELVISSSQGGITSEEKSSPEDENEAIFTVNTTLHRSGERNNDPAEYIFVARVATIVGSLVFVVIVLGCIVCCCPKCCRGTERRGFVLGGGRESLPQAVITQPPQQPAVVQHVPPEYTEEPVQQFAPQYQQPVLPPSNYAPVQQGYQYSSMQPQHPYAPVQTQIHYSPQHPGYQNPSTLQFYNPPEAPPPYEPTAPK